MTGENSVDAGAGEGLPRLLYFGDVPVSNSYGGATLLYRLLRGYPQEKLVICAPTAGMDAPLPGVRYVSFDARWPRLLRTRFSPLYCAWISWRWNAIPRWSLGLVREFRPEAILTISQTSGWILAWRLAQRERLPLFVFAHDDHVFYRHLPRFLWNWAQRSFGEAYRYATARFCISDAMAEEYGRMYGVASDIQFPLRDSGNPVFDEPAPQVAASRKNLTFAYAGSIQGESGVRQVLAFAAIAANQGHKLVVYSAQHEAVRRAAAGAPGLDVRAPIPSRDLIGRLRDEADCLLVTASFDPLNADVVTTQFPSKVSDYSSVGLPVFAWAPAYASLARFVEAYPDAALLVTDPEPGALAPAIENLAGSAELRLRLAKSIIEAGRRVFSPDSARAEFEARLRSVGRHGNAG